mgnify:CR=1 FL=1
MEVVNNSEKSYILRLDPGEELRGVVEKFCSDNSIELAWVSALGACGELELAYYNLDTKEYETKFFTERLEIATIVGNTVLKDGKQFMHAHGTFSDPEMKVMGGHINRCVISATCEVYISKQEGSMERCYDEPTGLYTLCRAN